MTREWFYSRHFGYESVTLTTTVPKPCTVYAHKRIILSTDLISECLQFKSLKSFNKQRVKVTQEMKSKKCYRIKLSSEHLYLKDAHVHNNCFNIRSSAIKRVAQKIGQANNSIEKTRRLIHLLQNQLSSEELRKNEHCEL